MKKNRKKKGLTFLKIFLSLLLVSILLSVGSFVLLLSTERGSRSIIYLINRSGDGEVESILDHGSILRGFTLRKLVINKGKFSIEFKNLRIKPDLHFGQFGLVINSSSDQIVVQYNPENKTTHSDSGKGFALGIAQKLINRAEIKIKRFDLRNNKFHIQPITQFSLSLENKNKMIKLDNLSLHLRNGLFTKLMGTIKGTKIALSGSYQNVKIPSEIGSISLQGDLSKSLIASLTANPQKKNSYSGIKFLWNRTDSGESSFRLTWKRISNILSPFVGNNSGLATCYLRNDNAQLFNLTWINQIEKKGSKSQGTLTLTKKNKGSFQVQATTSGFWSTQMTLKVDIFNNPINFASFIFKVDSLDLSKILPNQNGHLSFSSCGKQEGSAGMILEINKIKGIWHEEPIKGFLQMKFNKNMQVDSLAEICLGNNYIKIGKNDRNHKVIWSLKIENLGDIINNLKGSLTGSGNFPINLRKGDIDGIIRGHNISYFLSNYGNIGAKAILLNFSLNLLNPFYQRPSVQFKAEGIKFNHTKSDKFQLDLNGEQSGIRFQIKGKPFSLSGFLRRQGEIYNLLLQNLKFTDPNNKDLWQAENAVLEWSKEQISLKNFRLYSDGKWLLINKAIYNNKDKRIDSLEFKSKELPNSLLFSYFLSNFQTTGSTTADFSLNTLNHFRIRADLSVSSGSFTKLSLKDKFVTSFPSFHFKFDRDKNNHEQLILKTPSQGDMIINLEANWLEKINNFADLLRKKVILNLSAKIKSLQEISYFSPWLSETSGYLETKFRIENSIQSPRIFGHLTVNKGSLLIPQIGLNLKQIQLRCLSKGDLISSMFTGNTEDKKNPIKILIKTYPKERFRSIISVTGKNLYLMNKLRYQIFGSLDLKASIENFFVSLTGEVDIIDGKINLTNHRRAQVLPVGIISFQDNLEKNAHSDNQWKFRSNAILKLSNKGIEIDSKYLSGKIVGSLELILDQLDQPRLSGILRIKDGISRTLNGNSLEVDRGRIIYNQNPINNPALDIDIRKTIQRGRLDHASELPSQKMQNSLRSGEEFIVGLTVSGTAKKPKIDPYSSSAELSKAEILSYLLFGTGTKKLSPTESTNLLAVAGQAGIKTMGITRQLRDAFGFTELNFENMPVYDPEKKTFTQNTYFYLGKKLTPNLTIRYIAGLTKAENIFQVRFKVGKHWLLRTESSNQNNSLDLFYNLES